MTATALELLHLLHTVGTLVGAGGIAFAEFFYTKAVADGYVDRKERRQYLKALLWPLRWGMGLVLLSSIMISLTEYSMPDLTQSVMSSGFWTELSLAVVIIVATWLMVKSRLPLWLGSSSVLIGWWMLLLIDAARPLSLTYSTYVVFYIVSVLVTSGVLSYLRVFLAHARPRRSRLPI